MPKQNYTHISVVMDRSGSMGGIAKDMEGGLKSFIENQKSVEGEATLTFARFDTDYEVIYDFVPLASATDLSLQPRGSTALLDAMGITMESVKTRIGSMAEQERPEKAIFIFLTDGAENASTQYNRERVFDMISTLRNAENDINRPDENGVLWEFIFLGANQDAISAGGDLGIRAGASMTYAATDVGSANLFRSLNTHMTSYRTKGAAMAATLEFSDEDRAAQNVPQQKTAQNAYAAYRSSVQVPSIPDLNDTNLDINQKTV